MVQKRKKTKAVAAKPTIRQRRFLKAMETAPSMAAAARAAGYSEAVASAPTSKILNSKAIQALARKAPIARDPDVQDGILGSIMVAKGSDTGHRIKAVELAARLGGRLVTRVQTQSINVNVTGAELAQRLARSMDADEVADLCYDVVPDADAGEP